MNGEKWAKLRGLCKEIKTETGSLTLKIRDSLWGGFPGMTIRGLEVNVTSDSISFSLWAEGNYDRNEVLRHLSSTWGMLLGEEHVQSLATKSDGKIATQPGHLFSAQWEIR